MEKLKILCVLQTPWGTGLGMSKVHYDLKKEYEKLGHDVDYLDWNKLYPKGQTTYDKIFGPFYTERILKYLQQHAYKYDVIDANFNCIPYPKSAYHFQGVVVYRSHGLQPLYRQIEQSAPYKRTESLTSGNRISVKTRIGNLYRFLQKKDGDYELFSSIVNADIVHALNLSEYNYFIDYGIAPERVFLVPNGVPDEQINIGKTQIFLSERSNELSFIGSWTVRKGIKDLSDIVLQAQQYCRISKINILGGGVSDIDSYFAAELRPLLHVKPHFTQQELPQLLSNTKVGIFPSYVEGFGLAILEQLALGIPVIAYDTAGPSGILQPLGEGLLIKPGDKMSFGKKVADLLNLPTAAYNQLSSDCQNRAGNYEMSSIATKFIEIYRSGIEKLKKSTDDT